MLMPKHKRPPTQPYHCPACCLCWACFTYLTAAPLLSKSLARVLKPPPQGHQNAGKNQHRAAQHMLLTR